MEKTRIIKGFHASRIYGKIPELVLLNENKDLVEVIEKEFSAEGWKALWLSEGMNDYAMLFTRPDNIRDIVFLFLDIEDKLYLMDGEELVKDPAMAYIFMLCIKNYIDHQ